MKYIIQVGILNDNYCDMEFGYVGRDLETRKLHYYVMFDKQGNYSPHCLKEINIHDINQESNSVRLMCCLSHSNYKSYEEKSSKLPEDILSLIPEMINKHFAHNEENGLPTEFITNNLATLSVEYTDNISVFGDSEFAGKYDALSNIIGIPISKHEWNNYDDHKKKDVEDTLFHEVGHFKASVCKLDIENKQLNVRIGFYNSIVDVDPIVLANGDVFLKINEENRLNDSKGGILEEVINEFDCRQIKPGCNQSYPKVGHILNQLCDGRLLKARYYDDGIEELYESLSKIIQGRSKVDRLLESIICATETNEFDYEEENKHMMELLDQYQKVKSSK